MSVQSSEWTREVHFIPPYDHRDEKRNGGAHGMDIVFVLAKADGSGAISASIGTDWMRHPLKRAYHQDQPTPRERWDKPGMDAGWPHRAEYYHGSPNSQVVALHMRERDEAHDWWRGPDPCNILDGECYGDQGFIVCDDFLVALIEGGHEAAWKWLEECWVSWVEDDPDA